MILSFSVNNFLSYDKKTTISFVKGKYEGLNEHIVNTYSIDCLKSAVIFGSNSHGKTNLLLAMDYLKLIVTGHHCPNITNENRLRLEKEVSFKGFGNNGVSDFELTVAIECSHIPQYFTYKLGFDSQNSKIIYEQVFRLNEKDGILIFERKENAAEITDVESKQNDVSFDRPSLKEKMDNVELRSIYECIENISIAPSEVRCDNHYLCSEHLIGIVSDELKKFYDVSMEYGELINKPNDSFLLTKEDIKSMDFGIHLINGKMILHRSEKGKRRLYEVVFRDNNSKIVYSYNQTSSGLHHILDILCSLWSNENKNEESSLIMIDDLSYSFHPLMTLRLMDYILSIDRWVQFLITMHDSEAISFNHLRRDEIWFVEKRKGSSTLYSLENYSGVPQDFVDIDYINGRFGAIPRLNGMRLNQ